MTELLERLGRLPLLRSDDVRRILVLLVVCTLCALLIVDYTAVPTDDLAVGDVATRTVEAPYGFRYQDYAERERLQAEARQDQPWVYVYRADMVQELSSRVKRAFAVAREDTREAMDIHGLQQASELTWVPAEIVARFRSNLGVYVPDDAVESLLLAGFPVEAERLTLDLLARAMRGLIIADKEQLPPSQEPIAVIEVRGADREEVTVGNFDLVATPDDARERISLGLVESNLDGAWVDAAATVARASIRPNLVYDHLETAERQEESAAAVPMTVMTVKTGTTLFRQGDVITDVDLMRYRALQSSRSEYSLGFKVVSVALFLLMLFAATYHFGSSYLEGFSTRVGDVLAVGGMLVFTALVARAIVGSSASVAELLGAGAIASSIWFVVPVAGLAMLVRLLIGVNWGVVFAICAAAICGLVMDLSALYVVFVLLSCIAAAGAVEQTRERMAVLRAGAFVGLVNAATVLLIHFLDLFVSGAEVSVATSMRPVWSMSFGFLGGILSAFLVLGLMPVFEAAGFVTDYRMLELANLNHPLLRQLMLRAPGSYHHSVIVGSLSEAGCEAIGANALQARVAAYFHDIGKARQPEYFVENQRGSLNRHDRLDPHTSARVIINHVTDGVKMAREHGLPKPIIDNIRMHHGTGLLFYFFRRAQQQADDPNDIDEASFRYPGPKPNTREAGVIMLADKIEAATRTIKEPTEDAIRAMISKIINSVMADGQFEQCPLTFQELYTIGDTFVSVLMGIYHHRIEYDDTKEISSGQSIDKPAKKLPPVKSGSVITLEIPAQPAAAPARTGTDDDDDLPVEITDYEAVENLPREN